MLTKIDFPRIWSACLFSEQWIFTGIHGIHGDLSPPSGIPNIFQDVIWIPALGDPAWIMKYSCSGIK